MFRSISISCGGSPILTMATLAVFVSNDHHIIVRTRLPHQIPLVATPPMRPPSSRPPAAWFLALRTSLFPFTTRFVRLKRPSACDSSLVRCVRLTMSCGNWIEEKPPPRLKRVKCATGAVSRDRRTAWLASTALQTITANTPAAPCKRMLASKRLHGKQCKTQ